MRRLILWLAAVLALAGTAAQAATYPPRPAGPIYDAANLIPEAEEAALDARLREVNQRTGNAVIVATVPSLEDEPIETYATKLYETWGIGGKERDTGVLLLVAPTERKVRIEVGYGLHPWITDIYSGRIIRNEITPRFKAGDMAGGIGAGVDAILAQLAKSPEDAKAIAEAAAAAEASEDSRGPEGVNVGSVIFWIVALVFFISLFGRRGRGGARRSGIDPGIVLWGLSEVMRHSSGGGGSSWGGGGGGGGFGGFGGGMSGGGGASGSW